MDETPFNLTFETEVVTSVEISLPTLKTENFEEEANLEQLRTDVDLLEETQEWAWQRTVAYQQKVARYYYSRIKAKTFWSRDFVLWCVEVFWPLEQGKLAPNWKGPCQIIGAFDRRHTDSRVSTQLPFLEHGTSTIFECTTNNTLMSIKEFFYQYWNNESDNSLIR